MATFCAIMIAALYFCKTVSAEPSCDLYFTSEVNNNVHISDVLAADNNTNWIARGCFNDSINSTGFGYLQIETNSKFSDRKQAYHAGYLEGWLTSHLIYSHWYNVVDFFCRDIEHNNCSTINNFLDENSNWVHRKMMLDTYPYWYQVNLFYNQLKGVHEGYNSNTRFQSLNWRDILWINLIYEMADIQGIVEWNRTGTSFTSTAEADHCSVLIKLMPDNRDVYFGHNTWIEYQLMLRILKKYVLPFKTSENGATIPGLQMTMSSYPASIISIDDFYLISSGLAVTETTNLVFNKTLYKDVRPEAIVWEGFRAMIANRLATDGKTWHEIFALWNSGTNNNQWMVFDYNKFKPGSKLAPGSLWISEQMPSIVLKQDVTDVLNSEGYWSSYNVPYMKTIYEMSGYAAKMASEGIWFSYTETPRAKIFKRDQGKVTEMDTFMDLMRSNDFTNEPFAKCNCTPPFSARGAIAAREDLNAGVGESFNACKPTGSIDAKITNSHLFRNLQFVAVSGPTTGTDNKLPPFRWSTSKFSHIPHMSHPDVFDFEPVLINWTLPLY